MALFLANNLVASIGNLLLLLVMSTGWIKVFKICRFNFYLKSFPWPKTTVSYHKKSIMLYFRIFLGVLQCFGAVHQRVCVHGRVRQQQFCTA